MSSLHLQKWHPRHWLLPLTLGGLAIMAMFILKTYVPHPDAMLPDYAQLYSYAQTQGAIGYLLLLDWTLFWALFIATSLLIPLFLFKSVQFLRAGAHQLSDKNVMETAGWFGLPLSLAMYTNIGAFGAVMFFGLGNKQDDILWPFWLGMDLVIALMALGQYLWYRRVRRSADNAEQYSMVVPFAIGFMGLNLAGPGAFTENATVATLSMGASLAFLALSVYSFFSKLPALKHAFQHLWIRPEDEKSRALVWGHQINLATAITTVNVWQIILLRNYLNYGHNFGDFSIAFKNSLTWGVSIILPLVAITLFALWRSGFFTHLLTASKNYLFSLGQICMLVSSYVMTAMFTGTAAKAGIIAKYGLVWNIAWMLELFLATLTLMGVGLLLYRMVLLNNIQSWQTEEVSQALKS